MVWISFSCATHICTVKANKENEKQKQKPTSFQLVVTTRRDLAENLISQINACKNSHSSWYSWYNPVLPSVQSETEWNDVASDVAADALQVLEVR